jgi:hypothetical protein
MSYGQDTRAVLQQTDGPPGTPTAESHEDEYEPGSARYEAMREVLGGARPLTPVWFCLADRG